MTRQLLFDGQKSIPLDLNNEALWTSLGNGVPVADEVRVYYERVGLLYRCVNIRATSLSKVPWVVNNAAGETLWQKGEPPPEQLKWLRLLPRLLVKTEAALCLGSQAFWHKERNRVRATGLRWFAPVATTPWWDVERGLTHFVHNTGVRLEEYPPDDMVYLWYQHPLHETLRDVSPAEAAMAAAGVLYNVDAFVSAFFQRGAIKATLLTVKGNPQKAEMERLKAWWNRVFSGIKNAFKTDVISADAVAPVVVGEGISELSNTELTGEKERAIVYTMGVPFSMVFSDAANYATAGQDEQNFYNSTIIPDCELIAEQLGEQLLDEMGLHLAFKSETMDVFQTDEAEKAQSFGIYVSNGVKPSIAGQMLGLELPDGVEYADLDDDLDEADAEDNAPPPNGGNAMPGALDAEDEAVDPAKASEMRRFRAWAKKRAQPDPAQFHSRLLSEAEKATLLAEMGGGADHPFFTVARRLTLPDGAITLEAYKSLLLQLDPSDDEAEQKVRLEIEQRLERELSGALREQLTTLLPDDASDDAIRAAVGQVEATSLPVREVLRRSLEQSASLGVTVALDTLQGVGLAFDWTLAHTEASRWASQYSYELVRGINSTTATRLQTAVDDWFQERTTLPDLVKELQPTFGRRRAKLIAQTETTRAAREGSTIGFEQSGVVDEVEWYVVKDERVCEVCGGLHGKRMPLRGGATYPPAHPGCRCFVRPILKEAS